MAEDLEVSPVTEDDLDEVCRVEQECFGPDAYPREIFRALLEDPRRIFLKASSRGRLLGFVAGLCVGKRCYLYTIDVGVGHRRRGVGAMLLDAFEREARERNAEEVILQVEVTNIPALSLYLKRGYMIRGLKRNYYGPGRDAYEASKTIRGLGSV